jgi:hypothetical protein
MLLLLSVHQVYRNARDDLQIDDRSIAARAARSGHEQCACCRDEEATAGKGFEQGALRYVVVFVWLYTLYNVLPFLTLLRNNS